MYHLAVSAGSSGTFKVGTEYEQLIGKLLDADGDPGEKAQFALLTATILFISLLDKKRVRMLPFPVFVES